MALQANVNANKIKEILIFLYETIITITNNIARA